MSNLVYNPDAGLEGAMPSKNLNVGKGDTWFGSAADEDGSPLRDEEVDEEMNTPVYNPDDFLPPESRQRKIPPVALSPAKETKKERSKLTQKEIDQEIRAEQEYFGKMVPGLQPEEEDEEPQFFEPSGEPDIVQHPFPGRNAAREPFEQYQEQIHQEQLVHHPQEYEEQYEPTVQYDRPYEQEIQETRPLNNMFPEQWQPQTGENVTKNGNTLAKIGMFLLIIAIMIFVAVVVVRRSFNTAIKNAVAK